MPASRALRWGVLAALFAWGVASVLLMPTLAGDDLLVTLAWIGLYGLLVAAVALNADSRAARVFAALAGLAGVPLAIHEREPLLLFVGIPPVVIGLYVWLRLSRLTGFRPRDEA